MKNILFLCTHNSCRSIMAEGLLQHFGKEKFNAYSAGSFPSGNINPQALETLKRNHIDAKFSDFKSKSWDGFNSIKIDIVITVCDQAAGESCPAFFGTALKAHWGVTDPSASKNPQAFDAVFAILKRRIKALIALPNITTEELNNIGKL